jgi:predicted nucleic acid-binding protein
VVVPVTAQIAREGGQYHKHYRPSHNTGVVDALIAATAHRKGATLVTHNTKHFPMLENIIVPY